MTLPGPKPLSVEELFEKHAHPGVTVDDCWTWTGGIHEFGYGVIYRRSNGRKFNIYAHRFSFELHVRSLKPHEYALHECDNPPCCNPRHLYAGTHTQNLADMRARGRGFPVGLINKKIDDETKQQIIHAARVALVPQSAIAKEFGVCQQRVSQLKSRGYYEDTHPGVQDASRAGSDVEV